MSTREIALNLEVQKFIDKLDLYLKDFVKTQKGTYAYQYTKDDEKIMFKLHEADITIARLKISINYNMSSKCFTESDRSPMKFLTSKPDVCFELGFSTFKSDIAKAILFHDIIIARTYRQMYGA